MIPHVPTELEAKLNAVGWSFGGGVRGEGHSVNTSTRPLFDLLVALVADNQRLQLEVDKLWKVLNARTEHLV